MTARDEKVQIMTNDYRAYVGYRAQLPGSLGTKTPRLIRSKSAPTASVNVGDSSTHHCAADCLRLWRRHFSIKMGGQSCPRSFATLCSPAPWPHRQSPRPT